MLMVRGLAMSARVVELVAQACALRSGEGPLFTSVRRASPRTAAAGRPAIVANVVF